MVQPKKHLGQHFLKDKSICDEISRALTAEGCEKIIEVGPGTGALTEYLLLKNKALCVAEIDRESIEYLSKMYPDLEIFAEDFIKMDFDKICSGNIAVVGNFPYNVSSQILFKVYDERQRVPEMVGMFQKEVALRVAAPPGSKTYGILSVLLQAFYDIEYLFTVDEHVFNPPPKVKSGVIRMVRNQTQTLPCDEKKFKQLIKLAFNQRRKTMRNAIKPLLTSEMEALNLLHKRAEELHYTEFVALTRLLR